MSLGTIVPRPSFIPSAPVLMPSPAGWFTPGRFAGMLAVLLVAAFPEAVFGTRSFFYRDFGVLAYPTVAYAREAFWRGELPLWNPLSHCGVPFLAQWGTMVLYPGSLIYLLLPLPWSLNLFALLHLWLAGFGMYWLARRWLNDGGAASLAGVAFVFNGVTMSCLLWPNYTVALGWMPFVVRLTERAWREGGRRVILAALAGTLQMLAGVPELVGMTWLVVAAWWFCQAVFGDPEAPPGTSLGAATPVAPSRGVQARRLVGVGALVAGLSAAQWLPFLELLALSQRAAGLADPRWSLPLAGLANLVVPRFHTFPTTQGAFFQHGQEFFSSTYLGAGLVALAVLGVGVVRDRRFWVLLALSGLGLGLALGNASPLTDWLGRALPIAGLARYPVKLVLLAVFALPLLAAFAMQAWVRLAASNQAAARVRLMGSGGVVLLAMAVILWIERRQPMSLSQWDAAWPDTLLRAAALGATLLFVGLLPSARQDAQRIGLTVLLLVVPWAEAMRDRGRQNPTLPTRLLQPGLIEAGAHPQAGEGRVMISPQAEASLLNSRVAGLEADFTGKRLALWSNLNLLERVPKVNGAATLRLREQAQVEQRLYDRTRAPPARLMDFLGVTQTSSASNLVEWVPRATARPLISAGHRPVFVAAASLPDALVGPEFAPDKMVYLPEAARDDWAIRAGNSNLHDTVAARITPARFGSHRLEFAVESPAPAWVVVAQSYHPAWRVWVNGARVPLWRANHAFQAFVVPAGCSDVRLVYQDRRFWLGLVVSVLTSAGCALGWRRTR